MKKLLILDSNSIINRAYYGISFLSASDGTPTNAVYGFMNILSKLITDHEPDYLCAAFDLKAPTFRHKMYSLYKAQRKPMPDGLAAQMPLARELVREMNIPLFEIEGFEADDIIGTVSRICNEQGVECLIATGDRDDLQLASKTTKVLLTSSSRGQTQTTVYDEDAVFERYGVTPAEFIDVKALMGDASDNIPGVKGIGEKTATKIIAACHSIENLYADPEAAGIKGAVLAKITEGEESARLSKTLSAINTNVPMEFDIEKCAFSSIKEQAAPEFYTTLKRLELNSVIKRLDLSPSEGKNPTDLLDNATIHRKIPKLSGEAALILSTSENRYIRAIAAAVQDDAYVMTCTDFSQAELFDEMKRLCEDRELKKTVFDIKNTLVEFAGEVEFEGIENDIAIAEYLVNPSRGSYNLEQLALEYLGVTVARDENAQLSLLEEESDSAEYFAQCALALWRLKDVVLERIEKNGQEELYRSVELPLVRVLANMQIRGFLVDEKELDVFSKTVSKRAQELTEQIYALSGEEFNINSPKQLGSILFEKLGLPSGKKTKNGYSTNADVLENIIDAHPIVGAVLDYRKYAKLKSTYCDGLKAVINPNDHRIHSIFTQTVTVTGRISSTEPNLQNIPTRTELGREMRKMFVAKEGYTLVDADYSQIELRILAHIADDKAMLDAFAKNEDIHAYTAAQVLGIPVTEVTKEQRSAAKAVNFGIVYGISEFSLSRDIHSTVKAARAYMDSYLEKYHGVREYMERIKEQARRDGYVTTLMNRIRYIPELKSSNYNTRQFGERVALNTPIQGSAADIIKAAMVRVDETLKERGMRSRLILQVHDELIVEAENSEIEEVKEILRDIMENVAQLKVPLIIDMSQGRSWYDAK
ncbi:MAG: DNA polymerase I [Clostridiales bacterium]|nr:DNA polymerase I [Clostridiales bacterium]